MKQKKNTHGSATVVGTTSAPGRKRCAFSVAFACSAKVALLLAIVAICLLGNVLHSRSGIFRDIVSALLHADRMLLACLAVWCGTFIYLTFSRNDLPLIGLLLVAILVYFSDYAASGLVIDGLILFVAVTLGKGAKYFLRQSAEGRGQNCEQLIVVDKVARIISKSANRSTLAPFFCQWISKGNGSSDFVVRHQLSVTFLVGLIGVLACSSWWHLAVAGPYRGPRWMGLWDNPNIYGMLMGVGVVLAIGFLAASLKTAAFVDVIDLNAFCPFILFWKSGKSLDKKMDTAARVLGLRVHQIFLFIAAGMMAFGLLFSYSRGSWAGTTVGLLYLVKAYGKLKWQFVLTGLLTVAAVVFLLWHSTAETDAWYLKRLDFSRPSAQHRVSAWRAGFQMIRDHPFGVGWNKAVGVYAKDYSPPEGGAAALTMNSYLMLGTKLGIPALFCFVAYVTLRLRIPKPKCQSPKLQFAGDDTLSTVLTMTQVAGRAGILMLLVAFWFDGGLFDLPTASVFWVLLELGAVRQTILLTAKNAEVTEIIAEDSARLELEPRTGSF